MVTYCLNWEGGDCRAVPQPWGCENGLSLCDLLLICGIIMSCYSVEQFPHILAATATTVQYTTL